MENKMDENLDVSKQKDEKKRGTVLVIKKELGY